MALDGGGRVTSLPVPLSKGTHDYLVKILVTFETFFDKITSVIASGPQSNRGGGGGE
jgi:hypothetical protein